MFKVLVAYGTRPEAIKLAPVIAGLRASSVLHPVVAVTGQHRAMLDQVHDLFRIEPQHDLKILTHHQTPADITTRSLRGIGQVIAQEHPDLVLVQGDTTTTFAAALAAFYGRVPVAHLEAGLRTAQRYDPFPEEMNRRLTGELADIHLAPTASARNNLLRSGIDPATIFVTGNTVIDALLDVLSRALPPEDPALTRIGSGRMVLVTAHRRESWGAPMARIASAIARLASMLPEVFFLLPVHPNPVVREVLLPPLTGFPNVVVCEPLRYGDFARAMEMAEVVVTDSGGVQEEAPSLGKPVLVMRETTERPEAVDAGTVRLVGTDADLIVEQVSRLLTDRDAYRTMVRAVNPYGDGLATSRCIQAMEYHFGMARRPEDFDPTGP